MQFRSYFQTLILILLLIFQKSLSSTRYQACWQQIQILQLVSVENCHGILAMAHPFWNMELISSERKDVVPGNLEKHQPPSLLTDRLDSDFSSTAEPDTDEVFAQITLMPEPNQDENVHSFCKTLTASDTSTHGGFSVLVSFFLYCCWSVLLCLIFGRTCRDNRLHRNWWLKIYTEVNGVSGTFSEVNQEGICFKVVGVFLSVPKGLLLLTLLYFFGARMGNFVLV